MTFMELEHAWKSGARIKYSYKGKGMLSPVVKFLGVYDANKLEGLATLFYRQGVTFKVIK